ncbi:hypothetical protein [Corynebacterium heidelbergense]|uniref:Uncharacterized protein n=1 Tax=Corynebacterium heidelbergense TaxID=2055947 RepID=A0A364V7Y3_9CORY|nr:hypothetical protein [Corynebacterium heidelbergense]RAV32773.1 hypothetical protein DLJ54_01725 [Corynebacterium heidelbergense]
MDRVKKIFYPKHAASHHAVLAEQNADRSWSVEGFADGGQRTLSDDEFSAAYTSEGPQEYSYYWTSYHTVPSPNEQAASEGRTLRALTSKQELEAFWEAHPESPVYEPAKARVFVKGNLPNEWSGFLRPGTQLVGPENETYHLPYIVLE